MTKNSDTRINLRFNSSDESEYLRKYILTLKNNNSKIPITNQLGTILKEYEQLKANQLTSGLFAEEVSDLLVTKLRPFFMRALNADKNSKIILELLNGLIFSQRLDSIYTTDEIVTTPLKQATEKIERDIDNMLKRRAEKQTLAKGNS